MLLTHPAVADAAVVRIPDEEAGEVPKAFVVLERADDRDEDMMEYVAERVAPYKKVRCGRSGRSDTEIGLGQDPAPPVGRPRANRGDR